MLESETLESCRVNKFKNHGTPTPPMLANECPLWENKPSPRHKLRPHE